MQNFGSFVVYGRLGVSYRLEYTDHIGSTGSNDWQTANNFTLMSNPFTVTDPAANSSGARFYRTVFVP